MELIYKIEINSIQIGQKQNAENRSKFIYLDTRRDAHNHLDFPKEFSFIGVSKWRKTYSIPSC